MLKNITLGAFVAVTVSAMAQNWDNRNTDWHAWRAKYDTYAIASTDLNSISELEQYRILRHEEKTMPAAKADAINNFLGFASPDEDRVVLKALTANFKQASVVRDEVCMARFGQNDDTYAWMSYPPLTWGSNPGENSWASLPAPVATPTMTVVTTSGDTEIAMTDDASRPMRMVMRNKGWRDIDYDRVVSILGAPLDDYDKSILADSFHPRANDPTDYTNAEALDGIICLINQNANMVDHVDRYAWYNHFDKDYYGRDTSWSW